MAEIPPGSAVVTPSEMYAEIKATHDAVTLMRSELRLITDHETRIRSLERRMWIAAGAATILGGGLSEAARAIFGA
jgi:hypothetical protein